MSSNSNNNNNTVSGLWHIVLLDWRQIAEKKNLILKSGNQHAKYIVKVTDLLFTRDAKRVKRRGCVV